MHYYIIRSHISLLPCTHTEMFLLYSPKSVEEHENTSLLTHWRVGRNEAKNTSMFGQRRAMWESIVVVWRVCLRRTRFNFCPQIPNSVFGPFFSLPQNGLIKSQRCCGQRAMTNLFADNLLLSLERPEQLPVSLFIWALFFLRQ